MSHKRKGQLTISGEWARHLRPFFRRVFWNAERQAAKGYIRVDLPVPNERARVRRDKTRKGILVAHTQRAEVFVKLTAVFQKVPEGYIGFVEEVPGANTQGETLEEARENLAEALEMVLEANRVLAEETIIGQDVIREPLVVAVE